MSCPLRTFEWILLALGLIAASVADLRARRVPNALTMALLATGLTARTLAGGLSALGGGLLGAALGTALLILPFARRWIGGGDVKLLAAIGGWLGPELTVWAALYGTAAGGVLSIVYVVFFVPREIRREVVAGFKAMFLLQRVEAPPAREARFSPPYALALAVGAVVTVVIHAAQLIVR